MNFSIQEEIEAPISSVFEALTSCDIYKQAAMARGADVQRVDSLETLGVGMKWHAQFSLKGLSRVADIETVAYDPPQKTSLKVVSQGLRGDVQICLVALSSSKTQINLTADIRATTLTSRVMLQSLRLTKPMLDERLRERVQRFVQEMEPRYQQLT